MNTMRAGLPDPPLPIWSLPIDERGYPVPWFVAWLDADGEPCRRGEGTPDFRVLAPGAISAAHRFELCWVCGTRRGAHQTFVIGPMCAVNRVSAEPPSHTACAEWSVRACPFMTRPHMRRREAGLPDGVEEPAGIMLHRNPGVTLLWTTKRYAVKQAPGGALFDIGDPVSVAFWAEGRPATRAEVEQSIASGLPALQELADAQGPRAVRHLEAQLAVARELLPAA